MYDFVIYNDVPCKVKRKGNCIKKVGKKVQNRIHVYYGDVPVLRQNPITKQFEQVVNNRGYAYGFRNDMKYHKRRRYDIR